MRTDQAAQRGPSPAGGRTMGVEEEFLLVDAVSRVPVPDAPAVLAGAAAATGEHRPILQPELLLSQVESATQVCDDLSELHAQLAAGRRLLGRAARAVGDRLVSVGRPVLAGPPPGTTESERFHRIDRIYAGIARDHQTCGCHVHVGVPSRDAAVAVLNRLRPWLPTLLALSANSPYERGEDTGYQSWRFVLQSRFPGAGIPPACRSVADYDARLSRLLDCGVVVDRAMTFWLARPSEHLPTVEIRTADAAGGVEDAVLQAALSRALVRTALAEESAGRPPPTMSEAVAAAAMWAAARYGLSGPAVDPWHSRQVPAVLLLRRLLDHVDEALDAAGDRERVHRLVGTVLCGGTGAQRQRRAGRRGPVAVVDWLVERTMRLDPVGFGADAAG